jgi:hypothetical protein
MRAANGGAQLHLSPDTAYTLLMTLREWRNQRTPVNDYVQHRYNNPEYRAEIERKNPTGLKHHDAFLEFKRKSLTDRLARIEAVITQLED